MLRIVEGNVEMDAGTGGLRGTRTFTAGDDGAFEVRVKPGVDLHLLPDPDDRRFTFPPGLQMLAVPALGEDGGETPVRLVPRGRVSGVVIDTGGRPVEGARVSIAIDLNGMLYRSRDIDRTRAVSGADGSFLLEGVFPGPGVAVVAVKAPWRRSRSEPFPVEPGAEVRDVTVQLQPGAWIQGRVQDSAGNPLPGAVVWAARGNTLRWRGTSVPWDHPEEATTGADGRYAIEGLEEQGYGVTCSLAGFFPESVPDVAATPGGTEAPPFLLRSGETLRGTVVDEEGHPVADAVLSAHGVEGKGAYARSGEAGRFELAPLCPGPNKLYAGAQGFLKWEPREVPVPGPPEFKVVLVHGMTISGTVLDADGKPLPGATVVADPEHPGGGPCAAATSSDAQGRFSLGGLPAGIHVLETRAEGFTFPLLQSVDAGNSSVEIRGSRK
jgi:protocatechuate 3,4-dioxygenase beta subunit